MSNTNTGGPAFPSKKRVYRAGYATAEFEPVDGMTLRDFFAAEAMQGMMVDVEQPRCDYIAEVAYKMADAMLKARQA
jgi:hypothetical protein